MRELMPLTSETKKREFLVYDMEWVPGTYELRCIGVYDGNRYRWYSSVRSFFENELTKDNRHRWFFAHSGGRADLLQMVEAFAEDEKWEVDACMGGGSAFITTAKRHWFTGRCARGDHRNCWTWTFVDSFWLFRTSLKKIGKAIGMDKGGIDVDEEDDDEKIRNWYATVSLKELIDYNEQDCKILWHAIAQFQDLMLSLGSQLKMTIASNGMELFRRSYLKSPIKISETINRKSREAYAASRVEVYQREAHNGYAFDINSSFPYAMTFDAPGSAVRTRKGKIPDNHDLYIAEATVTVPDMYLPPLAFRRGARLFFPTGTWTSWFTGVDLQLLEKVGGKIDWVGECTEFERRTDMSDYASDLYERRRKATEEFEKVFYKYLMNALYGKFGETEDKESLLIHPDAETTTRLQRELREAEDIYQTGGIPDFDAPDMLGPGLWAVYRRVDLKHNHNPIAAHITAIARRTIYEYLSQPLNEGGEIHYCDTDSLSTNLKLWEDSDELGKLKLEDEFKHAIYLAPKVYRREVSKKNKQTGETEYDLKHKAKGFRLGRTKKTQAERFQKLIEEQELDIIRSATLKEMMRKRTLRPHDVSTKKGIKQVSMPKRKEIEGGKTLPWTVDELNRDKRG